MVQRGYKDMAAYYRARIAAHDELLACEGISDKLRRDTEKRRQDNKVSLTMLEIEKEEATT